MINKLISDQIDSIRDIEVQTSKGIKPLGEVIKAEGDIEFIASKDKYIFEINYLEPGQDYLFKFNQRNENIPLSIMGGRVIEKGDNFIKVNLKGYYIEESKHCLRTLKKLETDIEHKMKMNEESLKAFNIDKEMVIKTSIAEIASFYDTIRYEGDISIYDIEEVIK